MGLFFCASSRALFKSSDSLNAGIEESSTVVDAMRILEGTASPKNSSIDLYPSFESIADVSLSSGPTWRSVKVSRGAKSEEGCFRLASPRAITVARGLTSASRRSPETE